MSKQRTEAVAQRCSFKKVFLEIWQNSQEKTCARASFLMKLLVKANNFIKKETDTNVMLTQMFSCEFCEIFKNIFLTEHLHWLLLDLIDSTIFFLEPGCTKNSQAKLLKTTYRSAFPRVPTKNVSIRPSTYQKTRWSTF